MRILFIGDIVGKPGRKAVARILPSWRAQYQPDVIIANGENAAAGMGITAGVADELFELGIQVVTLGNHTFHHKEAAALLEAEPRLLRPLNYPPGVPGRGYGFFPAGEATVAVVSLMGRVFMDAIDDPFQGINTLLPLLREQTPCILIDMHAEATSEKAAVAWMVDGRASAVIGTHTHVPTADERILPGGTAFITDVGMAGPYNSILGVKTETIVRRFLTHMPMKFDLGEDPVIVCAVLLEIDSTEGRTNQITRLQEVINLTVVE
ncbi:MAG: TIGR00282 family metallophosphoesterase [Armatimonadota bacterium]